MKMKLASFLVACLFTHLFLLGFSQAATISPNIFTDAFNDPNNCSLRDAIQSVNDGTNFSGGCANFSTGSLGTNDTIILQAGDYVVSIPGLDNTNLTGDLDICTDSNDLLIQGQGPELTNVTGGFPLGQEDRIFDVIGCTETITMMDLAVSHGGGNTAFIDGAGIRNQNTASLTLQNAQVRDNVGDEGGGIFNGNNARLVILQSKITGNQAEAGGGILDNSGCSIPNGFLAINESTIDGNDANFGGGIYSTNTCTYVYNSTISRNNALQVNGFGGEGGGVWADSPSNNIIFLVNTTVSNNKADFQGGGIFAGNNTSSLSSDFEAAGFPPGIFLNNDTIAYNEAVLTDGQGGGIYFVEPQVPASEVGIAGPSAGPFSIGLFNTILANNLADFGPDCFDTLELGGFNLIEDLTDCTNITGLDPTTDITGTDPLLGQLQNNGGPTETLALMTGSAAIDKGNNVPDVGCQAPDFDNILGQQTGFLVPFELTRDQRNFPRPIAVLDPNIPICDIGAFEFQAFDFIVTKDDGLGGAEIEVGTNFDYTITVTNNGPGTATAVTLNDPLPTGMAFVSVTPSQGTCVGGAAITCDLGDLAVGETATITVSVTATETGDFTNIVTITLNNPFQQQLTETAQVTTVVTEGIIEGSGVHCGLQRGVVHPSPRFAIALFLMSLTVLGVYSMLRRRTHP